MLGITLTAALACSISAQPRSGQPASPSGTEIPLAGAQAIETRIGSLAFENGYPADTTVEQLFDEIDFQRACQAYLWALPAMEVAQMRKTAQEVHGYTDTDLLYIETYRDRMGVLTPNATTPYAVGQPNLAETGALVIDYPAGPSASLINDLWQRLIIDMGNPGPDKGQGAKYLLYGPEETNPTKVDGYITVQSTTNQVMIGMRALDPDAAKAKAWAHSVRIYPYRQRAMPRPGRLIDVRGKPISGMQPRGLAYWTLLSATLEQEPVQERDRFFMAMLRFLGIEKGKPFQPDARQKKLLEEAVVVGEAMARANTTSKRVGSRYRGDAQWRFALVVDPSQESQYYSQLDERAAWFYEAGAISKGMLTTTPGVGSIYLAAYKDKAGQWLDGGKSYRLRVPANPPAKQFWSVTLYDVDTRGLLDNTQQLADRSSRMQLAKNTDGSVDVHVGPTAPKGFEQNWVQTVPGRGWFAYFRLFGPTESYFDRTWPLPDFEEVK